MTKARLNRVARYLRQTQYMINGQTMEILAKTYRNAKNRTVGDKIALLIGPRYSDPLKIGNVTVTAYIEVPKYLGDEAHDSEQFKIFEKHCFAAILAEIENEKYRQANKNKITIQKILSTSGVGVAELVARKMVEVAGGRIEKDVRELSGMQNPPNCSRAAFSVTGVRGFQSEFTPYNDLSGANLQINLNFKSEDLAGVTNEQAQDIADKLASIYQTIASSKLPTV